MTGDRSGFVRNPPFHQIAVAAQREHVEIEQIELGLIKMRRQPPRSDGHADAIAAALAERTGRSFHAAGHNRFRMTGTAAADLPELLDLIQRYRQFACGLTVFIQLLKRRPNAAANTTTSTRDRTTTQIDRGLANRGFPDRTAKLFATACKQPGPMPWACPGGRYWPFARRPSPAFANSVNGQ